MIITFQIYYITDYAEGGKRLILEIKRKEQYKNKQVSVTPVCNKDICGYLRVKTLNKRGQNVENYLNSLQIEFNLNLNIFQCLFIDNNEHQNLVNCRIT